MLCCALFLKPMIARLLGEAGGQDRPRRARLAVPLEANGKRQHYMRARLAHDGGESAVTPLPRQDSSLVSILASADCLIVRPPNAPAAPAGEAVDILLLDF
jgi:molybdopterin molybdotransferase